MEMDFVTLTQENLDREQLCCIVRTKKPHPGVERKRAYCATHEIPAVFSRVETLAQAKALPCPFNNWAVFYGGRFVTVNQLDGAGVQKLLARS